MGTPGSPTLAAFARSSRRSRGRVASSWAASRWLSADVCRNESSRSHRFVAVDATSRCSRRWAHPPPAGVVVGRGPAAGRRARHLYAGRCRSCVARGSSPTSPPRCRACPRARTALLLCAAANRPELLNVVGSARKSCWVHRDVDRAARRDDLVGVASFGGDEQLAPFPAVEASVYLERLIDGHRREVAHHELAGERGFVDLADHEPGHVVERGGDDASVGVARRAFERLAQHDPRDLPRRARTSRRRRRWSDWLPHPPLDPRIPNPTKCSGTCRGRPLA